MVAPGNNHIKELFVARSPDGRELKLVRLGDGRCAITERGEIIRAAGATEADIDELVSVLLMLTDSSR